MISKIRFLSLLLVISSFLCAQQKPTSQSAIRFSHVGPEDKAIPVLLISNATNVKLPVPDARQLPPAFSEIRDALTKQVVLESDIFTKAFFSTDYALSRIAPMQEGQIEYGTFEIVMWPKNKSFSVAFVDRSTARLIFAQLSRFADDNKNEALKSAVVEILAYIK
jgi:hypothetical protein